MAASGKERGVGQGNGVPSAPAGSGLLDPRTVLLAMLSAAVWISSTRTLWTAGGWLAGLAILLALFWRQLSQRLTTIRGLLVWSLVSSLVTVILYLIFVRESDPGGSTNPSFFAFSSLATGIRMGMRLIGYVLLAMMVVAISSPLDLAAGLTRFLRPLKRLKVPVETVYYMTFFLFRMIPFLVTESQTIRLAQASRGIGFRGGLRSRVRASAALVVPVFAAAGRRAELLSTALWARGFDVEHIPAVVAALRLRGRDYVVLTALVAGWLIWIGSRFPDGWF